MKNLHRRTVIIIAALVLIVTKGTGQETMPEALTNSPLDKQINYIEEKTRIYENYRAIREDMFQKIKRNVNDSVNAFRTEITGLYDFNTALGNTIDSLNTSLSAVKNDLDEITRSKNSIKILGMEVNKLTYNAITWTIILGLVALLVIGTLTYNRNRAVANNANKEFKELKEEFETYRKSSREAREKMSMDHFNELKRLRGG